MATEMLTLLGQIEQQTAAADDRALAATALSIWPLPPAAPEPTTVDYYLRPLFEALADRLVAEVRSRYVHAVAQTVLARDDSLLGALYAIEPAKVAAIDDREVVRRLGQLLDKDGQLDALRRQYDMVALADDPKARQLRPGEGFTPPRADAEWWQFEGFLVALQSFLCGGEGKVADATFRVRYELPARPGGVWDFDATGKQFCYYAASGVGKGTPGFLSYGDRWGAFEQPLEWSFDTGRRPVLWLDWTHKVRTQAFRWPADKLDEDITFELSGCLAPLLLAWSGSADEGRWDVQFQPEGTDEKAKLRLSFQSVEGADLVLPARPPRPSGR